MSGSTDYLTLPFEYCEALGGLRWSHDGEAVETIPSYDEPGSTFIVTPALIRLIEGFPASEPLPNIGFVLHFMDLLGASMQRGRPLPHEAARLAQTFRATGRIMRNAGALCAAVFADLPRAPEGACPPDVLAVLTRPRWKQTLRTAYLLTYELAEVPPLTPPEFESRLLSRIAALSDDALRHWLKHGRGPVPGGADAAARLTRPALLATLAAIGQRPRMIGALSMVPNLSGALSLPPRRLARSELPSGGYTDLATRGMPEQILPAQFALDDLEFLRRYAERELLYFQRETPHQVTAEELVLVVDQGVCTWGDVRLVLAAAALAFARHAARRGRSLLITTTGLRGRMINVALSGPDELGAALEASDLSSDPSSVLGRILAQPAERPRDVVLLTHRRSLRNDAVADAARDTPSGTRVFAVSADADGRVALDELRHGAPVELAACRVEMQSSAPALPVPRVLTRGVNRWEGDVEPVPYPFRLGALQRFRDDLFVFDEQGEWMLLACAPGLLHAWKADGSEAEVLPRAWVDGAPLHRVEDLLGVAGGFAVLGSNGKDLILAHYDLGRRTLTAHRLGRIHGPERTWWYDRRHHSVVGCTTVSGYVMYAVDLAASPAEACYRRWLPEAHVALRARAAANAAPPDDDLRPVVLRVGDTLPESGRVVCLNPVTGVLSARRGDGRWLEFRVQDDGREGLQGAMVIDVQWRGSTLGLLANVTSPRARRLVIFREDLERPVAALSVDVSIESFALARNGQRFAVRVNKRQLAIHEVGRHSSLFVTPVSKAHSRIGVELGRAALLVRTSKFTHLFCWDRGPLKLVVSQQPGRVLLDEQFAGKPPPMSSARLLGGTQVVCDERFDNKRFVSSVWSEGLGALVDNAGHIVMVDTAGNVICVFHVYRLEVAAWLPDGTRLGPAWFVGGAPTPDGAIRVADALRAAAARGKEAVL